MGYSINQLFKSDSMRRVENVNRMAMSHRGIDIRQERDHYAAYIDGGLYCTGDTRREVVEELIKDGLY